MFVSNLFVKTDDGKNLNFDLIRSALLLMARKGNQQKNGLGGSQKKGGLQSGSATPNKKQKGSVSNTKDVKREEYSSDAQPSVYVTDPLHKHNHVKEDKKKTSQSGEHINVETQGTADASNVEQSEPCEGASQDYSADMSTTRSSCLEEDKWASANGIPGSKNRKLESLENLNVRYMKTFVLSILKASTEWLHKHQPLLDMLVTKILISRDYARTKIKQAYPVVLKWLTHFTSILLVLSMVWLDCTLRGIDSVMRMGTTSFITVIWCGIFSVIAMIGMLKFITIGVSLFYLVNYICSFFICNFIFFLAY